MNKLLRLKAKTIRTAVICGVAAAGCIAVMVGISMYNASLEEEVTRMRMQQMGMTATHAQIVKRFDDGQKTIGDYDAINPDHNPAFGTLDRKKATLLLENLAADYKLKNLSLDISPASVKTTPPYQLKTGGTNTSVVRITFESMTDEYAYSVLRDIIASFPGFLHISSANLTKNSSIDDEIIYSVQNGEIPPKVKSEFAFDWLGLEVKNETTTPPNAAPAAR